MAVLLRRVLGALLNTRCEVACKPKRSVSYVAESLGEDYGELERI